MNKYLTALIASAVLGLAIASIVLGNLYLIADIAYRRTMENYVDLLDRYTSLIDICNSSNLAFGWIDNPLEHKEVPTMDELQAWLQNDTTNEYLYTDPDFDCFHFALTLKLHGRAEHYEIGVVCLYGRRYPYGEPWFHCINAILASEGLIYIEPQADEIWHLQNHSEIATENSYNIPGIGLVYIEGIKIIFDC